MSLPWQWTSSEDISFPYLTGNSFSCYCKYVLNYGKFRTNPYGNNDWCFVKTDYLNVFFEKYAPKHKFILFTHNSDFPICDSNHAAYINDDRVIHWFAQNVETAHPKVKPIPIGVANAGYAHGNVNTLCKVRSANYPKDNLFYVNFKIENNNAARSYCLEQTGLNLVKDTNSGWDAFAGGYHLPNTFEGYLSDMARSYFTISPRGNGVDCHRTWEALYVGSIPIVTKSRVVEFHKDMPIIILDDWKDFKNISFNKELYTKIWNNFNTGELHIDNYLKRIKKIIQQ